MSPELINLMEKVAQFQYDANWYIGQALVLSVVTLTIMALIVIWSMWE